jgi:hypothetical protein
MLTGTDAADMLMESARVADPEPVSLTLMVKLALPAAVGVPAIWPEALRLSPVGSEPEARDQV